MKDCEGFECSKSEASLNRGNKTKTRTKTHIDNARSAAKDSAPLNQITVGENTGEVEKDKKGNYVLREERSVAGAEGDNAAVVYAGRIIARTRFIVWRVSWCFNGVEG